MTGKNMCNGQSGYFNTPEYLEYLKMNFEVVELSRDKRDETCKRPDIDLILGYTDRLGIKPKESLLEIGCGLGRLLRFFGRHYNVEVSGVDVSKDAVLLAQERLPERASHIKCAFAENLPFSDCYFDHVLCWAVFDLTEQGRALTEMMRVLKPGGSLLLTGKNNLFMDDDEDALVAEIKSREKGIPNHYTDYGLLKKTVELNGGELIMEHFFLRRGDFMRGAHLTVRPEKFIEYCIVIKKRSHASVIALEIATTHSLTWRQLNA